MSKETLGKIVRRLIGPRSRIPPLGEHDVEWNKLTEHWARELFHKGFDELTLEELNTVAARAGQENPELYKKFTNQFKPKP